MAIRADHISANSANGVFSTLCENESLHNTLIDRPDSPGASRLLQSYEELFDFLTALAGSKLENTSKLQIPPAQFKVIYNAVKAEQITPEELQLAPSLRTMEHSEFVTSKEMLALKDKLWPRLGSVA